MFAELAFRLWHDLYRCRRIVRYRHRLPDAEGRYDHAAAQARTGRVVLGYIVDGRTYRPEDVTVIYEQWPGEVTG